MGLSSKQVSSDGHDWNQKLMDATGTLELPKPSMKRQNQQQQQQSEPLKCPRCDSTNTKFCYYNNYNKSQPRHFCKTCKRHWTKGGTLRNVPVGGGRKNKRLKTTNTATANTTATKSTAFGGKSNISNSTNDHMPTQAQKQRLNYPLPLGDEKTLPDTLIKQPPSSVQECLFSSSLNFNGRNLCSNNGIFVGSALSLPLNQDLQYPYLSLTSFESNPSSISSSTQYSNLYTFTGEANSLEDTVMACLDTTVSSSSMSDLAWINPSTSSVTVNMPINLGWDDIEKLVSSDLTIPWDDAELKP
ncbi:hypothetical protein Ancab_033804 [Ancistrocladus abbreviatus]